MTVSSQYFTFMWDSYGLNIGIVSQKSRKSLPRRSKFHSKCATFNLPFNNAKLYRLHEIMIFQLFFSGINRQLKTESIARSSDQQGGREIERWRQRFVTATLASVLVSLQHHQHIIRKHLNSQMLDSQPGRLAEKPTHSNARTNRLTANLVHSQFEHTHTQCELPDVLRWPVAGSEKRREELAQI